MWLKGLKGQYQIEDKLVAFLDECSLDRNTFGHIFKIEPGISFLKFIVDVVQKDLLTKVDLLIHPQQKMSDDSGFTNRF